MRKHSNTAEKTKQLRLPIRKKLEKYIRTTHISENCVCTHTHFIRKVRVYTQKSSLRIYAGTAYGQKTQQNNRHWSVAYDAECTNCVMYADQQLILGP